MRRSSLLIVAFATVWSLAGCGGGGITPIETSFNKGAYQYSTGNYDAAIAEYEDAVTEDPADIKARFNLALAYEARDGAGDKAEARRLYDGILAEMPLHPRAGVNVAAIEWESGDREGANARLRQLIEADSDNHYAHGALSANLLREGNLDDAHAAVKAGLDNGDDTSTYLNTMLGDVELARKRYVEADAAYAKALERSPEDLHAIVGRAEVAIQTEKWIDARSWMQRVIYIQPGHWYAHRALADIAEREGRLEDAAYHWWEARRLDEMRSGPFKAEETVDYKAELDRIYAKLKEK